MPKVKAHLRALPYDDVSAALRTVDASQTTLASKLCLAFLIFTAARSGEAARCKLGRGGPGGRDLDDTRLPHEAGEEHRVPLSDQALGVLVLGPWPGRRFRSLLPLPPSPRPYAERYDPDQGAPCDRPRGAGDVHGFRTSFRTWTMEQTDAPWAVAEAALAHQLGGSVEQAYARSDLFVRRRALMAASGRTTSQPKFRDSGLWVPRGGRGAELAC